MTFSSIDQQAAEAAILSGVGRRDERAFVHILEHYRRDPDALSPERAFGHALKPLVTSSEPQNEPTPG